MSEPVWRWGALNLPVSSLVFYAALIIGLAMTYIEGRRKALPEAKLVDFLLLSLLGGMTGGRLVHAVLFDPSYYFKQPLRLLEIQDCGFSFWGGLACAFVAVSLWAYFGNLMAERYFDAAAPALAFSLACGHIGDQIQGGIMVPPLPWSVIGGGVSRHPDGVYAIILLMTVYFIIIRRRYKAAYEGELFIWFLLGYSAINILLDFVRDLPRIWGFLTLGQIFSILVLLLTVCFLVAGSKISASSAYLGRVFYRHKPMETALFSLWYLTLTAGMVLLYYWIHPLSTSL